MIRRIPIMLAALAVGCEHAPDHPHTAELTRVLGVNRVHWVTAEAPHIHLHAVRGTAAARRRHELAARASAALLMDLGVLGSTDDAGVIDVVVLPSREAMRPYTGGTPGGWAMPHDRAALVIADGRTGVPLRHEIMHVVSWQLWGEPIGSWISEGVAMLPTPVCGGYSVDELAAAMRANGSLVPLAELPARFTPKEAGHYAEAASLVGYVRRRYGTNGVRRLWRHGLRDTRAALGVPVEELEREWRASLLAAQPRAVEWERIRNYGCESA